MYIPQKQLNHLRSTVAPGKVVIIYGPRRVGKTTLLKKYLEDQSEFLFVTGDDIFVRNYLSSCSTEKLKEFIGHKRLLVIDEAQNIPEIGINLKMIVDQMPHVKIIATGSSTFDLVKHVGEPLTGRKHVIKMFPLSQMELNEVEDAAQTKALLEARMVYGSYPEVVLLGDDAERKEYLSDLVSSYLLKDILAIDGIRKSKKIIDMLVLIAYQIGKEVSISEIATQLSMNKGTVERYLDLMEQVFVLVNIRGFSRNLRKEVTKTSRYYFYDNGIRNALINNYNLLQRRDDSGPLWENYLVMERIKKQQYQRIYSNNYFWRTYDQKEIDWVEEREGTLFGYEFTRGKMKKAPQLWFETYPQAQFSSITPENYLPFIC